MLCAWMKPIIVSNKLGDVIGNHISEFSNNPKITNTVNDAIRVSIK